MALSVSHSVQQPLHSPSPSPGDHDDDYDHNPDDHDDDDDVHQSIPPEGRVLVRLLIIAHFLQLCCHLKPLVQWYIQI